jgi:acetolactate synthase-1/2/3 large subunit
VNVIDIIAVQNHHYMHPATLNAIENTTATLNALNTAATPRSVWADGQIKQTRSALATAFYKDDAWGPAAVVDICRDELQRDTLATVDSGAHRILLNQMWKCYAPYGLMQSSALCTMGCAISLAIGAYFIEPDRTEVSLCREAGFLMVAGELATAKELNLNSSVVVFVDTSLTVIELK